MPYFGHDAVGGAERANANLIKILDLAENIVFYTNSVDKTKKEYYFEGIKCIHGSEEEIEHFAKKCNPDLLIATHDLIYTALKTNFPYLIYLHDPRAHCFNANTKVCDFNCKNCSYFMSVENYKIAYKNAVAVAYCSNYLKKVSQEQYPEANYLEIPWIPLQNLNRNSFAAPASIIGTTAGVPHKGNELLLKLARTTEQLKFLLVGPSNIREYPQNIKYLGYIPEQRMFSDFYSKIGTYISLSTYGEAYGMTIVEAHAFGIPTLLPRSDGLSESGGSQANFIEKENFRDLNHWRRRLLELTENISLREYSIDKGYENFKSKSLYSKKISQSIEKLLVKI